MSSISIIVLLLLSLLSASCGQELLGSAASASIATIQQALDLAEQNANHMAWASASPMQVSLSGDAFQQLQASNEELLNKDLAMLLNGAKTSVQVPAHVRVQPIIQSVPRWPAVSQLPILNSSPRVEQLIKHRNPLLFQGAISTKSPMLQSKSSLAQAVLQRGMQSAQLHLEQQSLGSAFNNNLNKFGLGEKYQSPIVLQQQLVPQLIQTYGSRGMESNPLGSAVTVDQWQNTYEPISQFGYVNTPYTEGRYAYNRF